MCVSIFTSLDRLSLGYNTVFVSINRYERKKKIEIAISALKLLLEKQKKDKSVKIQSPVLLVVAGGYDKRVDENVEYLQVIFIV
jgi:alpha-1,3/alpha-1,6-mannosyltransferase